MRNELMYNKSGIKDITAYKAITHLCKGENNNMQMEVNKGEVWEVYNGFAVIINCFDRYAAVVMLQERKPEGNAVPVRVRDVMYADAGRLGYVYYDKMYEFVRKLGEGEEAELHKAIAAALELEAAESAAMENLAAARKEIEILRKDLEEAVIRMETAQEEAEEANNRVAELAIEAENMKNTTSKADVEELAAARKEAEIYKGLYENLLARALG